MVKRAKRNNGARPTKGKKRNQRARRGGNGSLSFKDIFGLSGGLSYGNGIGVATSATRRPLGQSMRTTRKGNGPTGPTGALTITGRDLLQTIRTSSTSSGTMLAKIKINPSTIPGQRLNTIATLYDRYTIKRMVFSFEGSVPTSQSGTLIGTIDYDVLETIPSSGGGTAVLQWMSAHPDSMVVRVWDRMAWTFKNDPKYTDMYTDQAAYEPRLVCPGVFWLIQQDVPAGIGSGLDLGRLYVDYEIEFSYPKSIASGQKTSGGAASWVGQGGTFSAAAPMGDIANIAPMTNTFSPWTISSVCSTSADGLIVTLPPGSYCVQITIPGTGLTHRSAWSGSEWQGEDIATRLTTDTRYPATIGSPVRTLGTDGTALSELRVVTGLSSNGVQIIFSLGGSTTITHTSLSYPTVWIYQQPAGTSLAGGLNDTWLSMIRMVSTFKQIADADPGMGSFISGFLPGARAAAPIAIRDDDEPDDVKTDVPPTTAIASPAPRRSKPA